MGPKMNPAGERRGNTDDERQMAWAAGLKARYDEVAGEPLPDRFRDLLEQIENAESRDR